VHTESFILEDSAVIDRVRTDILAAVHDGGAVARMGQMEWAPEVLVTPASQVRISRIPEQPGGEHDLDGDSTIMSWDDI
jgi:hypothetical protein